MSSTSGVTNSKLSLEVCQFHLPKVRIHAGTNYLFPSRTKIVIALPEVIIR